MAGWVLCCAMPWYRSPPALGRCCSALVLTDDKPAAEVAALPAPGAQLPENPLLELKNQIFGTVRLAAGVPAVLSQGVA